MKFIKKINIKNKKVLIRVDFNVPMENGEVSNAFRIKKSLDTIKYCIEQNASIVLISHLGRPNGEKNEDFSLEPIGWHIEDYFNIDVKFSDDCISGDSFIKSSMLKGGEVLLLENLRFHKGETDNDDTFSKILASHGDIFINDAFGTAHREHASNVGILKHFKNIGYGFLINDEIRYLKNSISNPSSPLLVIVGGSKISSKIVMLKHILKKADNILIGGAMAFTFLKALGYEVGKSLVEENHLKTVIEILKNAKDNNVNLVLPSDVVCAKDIDNPDTIEIKNIDNIESYDIGLDIGPETCINFDMHIKTANTIVWNGPVGLFENIYFSTGTQSIASSISQAKRENNSVTIIGGGDTVTAIENFNSDLDFTHISTGGGSSLKMLSGENLPALDKMDLS